jgi:hypothetical protein
MISTAGLASVVLLLAAGSPSEPIERRLVRTIQTGVPQQVEVSEILAHAKDPEQDFVGHVLARSALVAVGRDQGFPDWPLPRLLDRVLDLMQPGGTNAYPPRPTFERGFGGDDLAFLVVYAMVLSGQADAAVTVLEARLAEEDEDEFVRGVALQALRNIGGDRANRVIRRRATLGKDRNLPENLIADLHYPFLSELQERLNLVPPDQRGRRQLLAMAREGCGERSSVATYFLGFVDETDRQAATELDFLRSESRVSCFHNRYFAIRSLALRSAETIDFWTSLLRDERDAWQRAQLTRILFARFGPKFERGALTLLEKEPSQYVQWELMHGVLDTSRDNNLRDYWDIFLPTTLTYKLYFAESSRDLADADVNWILRWLEGGAAPRDPWVRNHLLFRLAADASSSYTRRYLRVFDAQPEKARNWWILTNFSDPRALPLLYYWRTLPSEESQTSLLDSLIERLQEKVWGGGDRRAGNKGCCESTRSCLLAAWMAEAAFNTEIRNPAEAQRWLAETDDARAEPAIRFIDPPERIALVTPPGRGSPRDQRWEYIQGCWRRVEL